MFAQRLFQSPGLRGSCLCPKLVSILPYSSVIWTGGCCQFRTIFGRLRHLRLFWIVAVASGIGAEAFSAPGAAGLSGLTMAAKTGNTVYWFRKALRLHDNPSLVSAIKVRSSIISQLRCWRQVHAAHCDWTQSRPDETLTQS